MKQPSPRIYQPNNNPMNQNHLQPSNKNPMNKLFKTTLLFLSCIILTALGFTILNADSTTTIGLDINTGNITSTGTITSQDLTIQKSDDTTLTIYSNTDTPTEDDKLLIVQKGTTPLELFSVDEDGDVVIGNDLSVTGNITSGTWLGSVVGTQYGGTGIDWSATTQGNLPYFSGTGTLSNLAPGTTGQFLSQGSDGNPAWDNVARTATVVIATSAAVNGSSILSQQQADYVCDGENDQVEIQAAIDALPDGGGRIVLMDGQYVCSDSITMKDGILFEGESYPQAHHITSGATLNFSGTVIDGFIIEENSEGMIIRNLKIVGSGKANGKSGIRINQNSDLVRIEHTLVKSFDECIYATSADSLHLEGVRTTDCGTCVHIDGAANEFSIYNGYFCNADQTAAIIVEGGVNAGQISGNEILSSQLSVGDRQYGIDTTGTDNYGIRIENNYFDELGGGIYGKNGLIIIGNTFTSITNGIAVECIGRRNIIQANEFNGLSVTAISVTNPNQQIVSNMISNDTGSTADVVIIEPNTNSVLMVANTILYGGNGIKINGGNKGMYSNNYIGGVNYCVAIMADAADASFYNNIFSSADTAVFYYGSRATAKRNNWGYTTESSGTATLPSGVAKEIAVDHGLNVTPSIGDIMVTPIGTWGTMTKFWIGNYTSSQFTIYADQDPGITVDFAWKAIVL